MSYLFELGELLNYIYNDEMEDYMKNGFENGNITEKDLNLNYQEYSVNDWLKFMEKKDYKDHIFYAIIILQKHYNENRN